jgi:site-specific recombinase XerD
MIVRDNYLKVKAHLQYLRDVLQVQPSSAERYWFYLRYLLLWLDDQPLLKADRVRPTFPVFISQLPGKDDAPSLVLESQKTILECVRRFFRWAKTEFGRELSSLPQSWIDTLRVAPSASEAIKEHVYVTEEDVCCLLQTPIAQGDLAMLRDRAAAAMLFLSGARAAAFTTLPIQAIRLQDQCIDQFPSLGVRTKKHLSATTYLLQLSELLKVVSEWDTIVRSELPSISPWFAVIESSWGEQKLSNQAPGENRAGALDKRLKRLYALADLPYRSAHKFRHGHAVYGLLHARTPADLKAVSMNLMHSSTRITDEIYSFLSDGEVRQHILGLNSNPIANPNTELEALIRKSIQDELHRGMVEIGKMMAD